MKKSMIWLGPAFVGMVVAIVTVALLIAAFALSDDDSTQHAATTPAVSATEEAHTEPTEAVEPTEEATAIPEVTESPTPEETPVGIFGG
jgi:hypothetical protein